jgi:uncharacterized protein (TIGR03790 family)
VLLSKLLKVKWRKLLSLTMPLLAVPIFGYIDSDGLRNFAGAASDDEPRVLIVYNANYAGDEDHDAVQDSLEVANYYLQKRGIPSNNLLGLNFSSDESVVDYNELQSQVIQPLQNKLAELGPTSVDVILFSYHTPYKYRDRSLDNLIMGLNYWNPTIDNIVWYTNPYLEPNPTFGTDQAHFDHTYNFINTDMYLVTRLDGPGGVNRVLDLVDEALYAERYLVAQPGYFNGNVYVDSRGDKGIYTDLSLSSDLDVQSGNYFSYAGTDVNIAYGEHYVRNSGLGLKWEKSGNIIGTSGTVYEDGTSAETAPNALFYGGWYAYGAYNENAWQWLPGSVAMDLDSINFGYSIRSTHFPAWGTQALAHGASAVIGVVGEPYTIGHPRPNVLLYYLLQGYTFAEASALSTPSIGWMAISIGDPLYAPFKTKTPVVDSQAPTFAAGSPNVRQSTDEGTVVNVIVDNSPEPEVALAKVDYGTTSNYGQTINSQFYQRQQRLVFPDLQGGVSYHYKVTVTDPAGNSTSTDDLTFNTPAQLPYGGSSWNIPGLIEIENFDTGGEGVAYHDSDPGNYSVWQPRNDTGVEIVTDTPRVYVFRTYSGEWLEYTVNVAQSGLYNVTESLSAYVGDQGQFHIEIDGVDKTGRITIPAGFPSTWESLTQTGINLSAGPHVMRLVMDAGSPNNGVKYGEVASFDNVTFVLTDSEVDTTPPTITLTNPSDGVTLNGVVSVSVDASDSVGIASVQFKLDGNDLGSEDTDVPYNFSWDTSSTTNGSHTLSAVARDAAGNTTAASAVTVTVLNIPLYSHLTVSPATLVFTAESGGSIPAPQVVTLSNSGNANSNWSANTSQGWCHISPASGALSMGDNSNLSVSVDVPSDVGTFNCSIDITDPNADNSPQSINVTYIVTAAPTPTPTPVPTPTPTPLYSHLTVSPATLVFTAESGGSIPGAQVVNLSNSGNANSNWSAISSQGWCHISPAAGAILVGENSNLSVSVDVPSDVGSFNCSIDIIDPNADNSPQTISVTYIVAAAPTPTPTPVPTPSPTPLPTPTPTPTPAPQAQFILSGHSYNYDDHTLFANATIQLLGANRQLIAEIKEGNDAAYSFTVSRGYNYIVRYEDKSAGGRASDPPEYYVMNVNANFTNLDFVIGHPPNFRPGPPIIINGTSAAYEPLVDLLAELLARSYSLILS